MIFEENIEQDIVNISQKYIGLKINEDVRKAIKQELFQYFDGIFQRYSIDEEPRKLINITYNCEMGRVNIDWKDKEEGEKILQKIKNQNDFFKKIKMKATLK